MQTASGESLRNIGEANGRTDKGEAVPRLRSLRSLCSLEEPAVQDLFPPVEVRSHTPKPLTKEETITVERSRRRPTKRREEPPSPPYGIAWGRSISGNLSVASEVLAVT